MYCSADCTDNELALLKCGVYEAVDSGNIGEGAVYRLFSLGDTRYKEQNRESECLSAVFIYSKGPV